MPIKMRCRQNVGAIDGRPLRLVDRGRVAVIKVPIEPRVDRDARSRSIQSDLQDAPGQRLDRSQRPVLHAKAVFVTQKVESVADGEFSQPELGFDLLPVTELAAFLPD